MGTDTARLLDLCNERERTFNTKVEALKSRGATVTGTTRDDIDLINVEAKLAELKECRREFQGAFMDSPA